MRNVYKKSYELPESVAKLPEVGEQGFQALNEPATPPQYPCADAVMYYARNHQGADMRGGVAADTAWELCCRTLSELVDIHSLSSRAFAQ